MIKDLQFCEVNIQKIGLLIKDRETIWTDLESRKRKLADKLTNKARLTRSLMSYTHKIDYEKL